MPYLLVLATYMSVVAYVRKNRKYFELSMVQFGLQCMIFIINEGSKDAGLLEIVFDKILIAFFVVLINIFIMIAVFTKDKLRKLFFTFGIINGVILMWIMQYNYLPVPRKLELEWYLLWVVVGMQLIKYVWGRKAVALNVIQNIVMAHVLVILLVHNVEKDDYIVSSIILAMTYTAYLVYGIYTSKKTYLITAIICMSVHFIYLSQKFWLSLPWWSYFMLVGLALIGVAVFMEVRMKNKEGKTNKENIESTENTENTESR